MMIVTHLVTLCIGIGFGVASFYLADAVFWPARDDDHG